MLRTATVTKTARVAATLGLSLVLALFATHRALIHMPPPDPRDPTASMPPGLPAALERHTRKLAVDIGPRHLGRGDTLGAAADYIAQALTTAGYQPSRQRFATADGDAANVEAVLEGSGSPARSVVVGAHYDTVPETPGADDNASGVAVLIELATLLRASHPAQTVRFVAFANEEPPYFKTEAMGSLVYARGLAKAGAGVTAMLSLECLGYFSKAASSQHYPFPVGFFYPSTGDFVSMVGNVRSRKLVKEAVRTFGRGTTLVARGAALPELVRGVGYSDHWSFWQIGVPALMVTDTAFFRNDAYHSAADLPERLDFRAMAEVTMGLAAVVSTLAAE
ncbi:MAG: M20/M25/M40 family metallo-hydrolase [Deltaproteobacteria bacterium]|nr:M20/M25/M40 family metallo-hydrolase [Deltaproteobacteria bacterium]